jgi:antitoxin VapB
MSLNIKNEQTHRLVRKLARLTGRSMTAAVEHAVRKELKEVEAKQGDDRLERILRIAREAAPLWEEPYKSTDHGDLLYDEKGLPK